jgi:shikimate dehydrogenase
MGNIYLTGFMASGKTTVGKALAERLHKSFIDTDEEIVRDNECSIADIFEREGEEAFRQMESELIEKLSIYEEQGISFVVSLGGGAIKSEKNIEFMKKSGTVILLYSNPEITYERTKDDENRPLLKNRHSVEGIKELMDERAPLYEKAKDFTVNTDSGDIPAIVDEIMKLPGISE